MRWWEDKRRTYETQSEQRKAVHSTLIKTLNDFEHRNEEQKKSVGCASVRQLKVCLASAVVVPIAVFTATSLFGISLFRRVGVTSGRAFGLSSLSGAVVGGWLA